MANVYLPINANWRRFYDKCEELSSSSMDQISRKVVQVARNIIEEMDQPININEEKIDNEVVNEEKIIKKLKILLNLFNIFFRYQLDPWLWVSDWSRKKKRSQWPVWYWGLFQNLSYANLPLEELKADFVKLMCRELPRVFGLCYGPYPLMFVTGLGWGYIVPKSKK